MKGKRAEKIGDTPVEAREAQRDGAVVIRLANSHADRPIEPNSARALEIARGVKRHFEDKKQKTPSLWKERSFSD